VRSRFEFLVSVCYYTCESMWKTTDKKGTNDR